jgi:hypothetical protein
MKSMLLVLMALATLAGNAQAQLGWTLDQCRKHWGKEKHIGRYNNGNVYYEFGSKVEKDVSFDVQGKVNDYMYLATWNVLNIPMLLAKEEGITWEVDPDPNLKPNPYSRGTFWVGKKDGVVVLYARYFISKVGEEFEVTTTKW